MMDRDLHRIRFVTERYADLRAGVLRAVVGPVVLALGLAGEGGRSSVLTLLALGAAVVILSAWVELCLDGRFGRVTATDRPRLTVIAGVGVFIAASKWDQAAMGSGRPSILFLVIAAYGLWLCIRQWPFTPHYAVPAICAAAWALLFASVNTRDEYLAWERHGYFVALVTWCLAGALDWLLLTRSLPRPHAEGPDAARF